MTDTFEAELDGFPYSDDGEQQSGREPVEVVLTEILERERNGERPSIEEYARNHPAIAAQIREMYPIVAAMEQWKRRTEAGIVRDQLSDGLTFERVGKSKIVRELGRGGMGVVFEGEHEALGRVAVKVLPWRSGQPSRQRQRFEREIQIASRLDHPNIVPVLEYGEWDGYCYYVMPFIEGVGLDWIIERLRSETGIVYAKEIAALRSKRRADAALASENRSARSGTRRDDSASAPTIEANDVSARSLSGDSWIGFALIGLQAADALRYAHAQSMVHRDIKPANLLVDRRGRVWITDFGLAQPMGDDSQPESDDLAGTPRYMAPERFLGKFDERSDIYALGMTLYELATRKTAFAEEDRAKLIEKITTTAPPRARAMNPQIAPVFDAIVMKAIARDPDKRYRTAGEMVGELLRFIHDERARRKSGGIRDRLTRWLFQKIGGTRS